MNSVQVDNLTKIYKSAFRKNDVLALDKLNLQVQQGTIFGLLGPNGAGKTTLVKILLGITFPTDGSAKILDDNINNYKVRERIGYLPENHKYPLYLTGGNVLKFFGKLAGKDDIYLNKKIDHLLDLVKLSKWKNTKIRNYSKGMMQRLGLAQAILNDPELIFLDEPTDGVDPIGRKEIRDLLLELKGMGKTIFLNSHLLSEVELITDSVAILNKGILIKQGTVKELTEIKLEYELLLDTIPDENFVNSIRLIKGPANDTYIMKVSDIAELNRIIDMVRSNGYSIKGIIPRKESLEDIFISLINNVENKK